MPKQKAIKSRKQKQYIYVTVDITNSSTQSDRVIAQAPSFRQFCTAWTEIRENDIYLTQER